MRVIYELEVNTNPELKMLTLIILSVLAGTELASFILVTTGK
jgi:hypothetical protein